MAFISFKDCDSFVIIIFPLTFLLNLNFQILIYYNLLTLSMDSTVVFKRFFVHITTLNLEYNRLSLSFLMILPMVSSRLFHFYLSELSL
jgi:hypothetical protein